MTRTHEEIPVSDPDYYCPVCGRHVVWITDRMTCCGATWAYCPNDAPYLLSVDCSKEFGKACGKHGVLDKEFKLMPEKVDG